MGTDVEASNLTARINDDEYTLRELHLKPQTEVERRPKEYKRMHLPDEYGGITFPVPVNPRDTKPVVVAITVTGEIAFADATLEHFVPEDHPATEPATVDIELPEVGIDLLNVVFESAGRGDGPWPFLAQKVRGRPKRGE